MLPDDFFWRRAIVEVSAVVYWGGVFLHARRVRRQIGRSPNVRPRGLKEHLLWAGWFLVVVVWLGLPWLARVETPVGLWRLWPAGLHLAWGILGTVLVAGGYAATRWCYAAMGSAWRMGIDARDKPPLITAGPYRWVRHPIYLFQIVILAGVACLLPTWLAVAALALHGLCVGVKAADEEAYLATVHGEAYRAYAARAGRLWPRIRKPKSE